MGFGKTQRYLQLHLIKASHSRLPLTWESLEKNTLISPSAFSHWLEQAASQTERKWEAQGRDSKIFRPVEMKGAVKAFNSNWAEKRWPWRVGWSGEPRAFFSPGRELVTHHPENEVMLKLVAHQYCLPAVVPVLCLCLENPPRPQSSASEDRLGCSCCV